MRETASRLIQALGEALELTGLELDAQGYCCVSFDGIVVNFEHEEHSDDMLLFAKVGDAAGDPGQRFVEEILDLGYSAMLTGGGCLGLDKAAGSVMFADRVALRGLDAAGFEKAIENYVDRADGWRNLLAGPQFARLTSGGADLAEVGSMMRI